MKKAITKISVLLILIILISSSFCMECVAVSGFTTTPLRPQRTDYWCWAASNQMLLETQDIIFAQVTIAGGINRGATLLEQQQRLTACANDIQWDLHYNVYSFEQIKKTINLGWAISCGCFSDSGGHSMVITGYDDNSAGFDNVWLQDPWGNDDSPHLGVEGWCNYAAPVLGNYEGTVFTKWQGYKWSGTIV